MRRIVFLLTVLIVGLFFLTPKSYAESGDARVETMLMSFYLNDIGGINLDKEIEYPETEAAKADRALEFVNFGFSIGSDLFYVFTGGGSEPVVQGVSAASTVTGSAVDAYTGLKEGASIAKVAVGATAEIGVSQIPFVRTVVSGVDLLVPNNIGATEIAALVERERDYFNVVANLPGLFDRIERSNVSVLKKLEYAETVKALVQRYAQVSAYRKLVLANARQQEETLEQDIKTLLHQLKSIPAGQVTFAPGETGAIRKQLDRYIRGESSYRQLEDYLVQAGRTFIANPYTDSDETIKNLLSRYRGQLEGIRTKYLVFNNAGERYATYPDVKQALNIDPPLLDSWDNVNTLGLVLDLPDIILEKVIHYKTWKRIHRYRDQQNPVAKVLPEAQPATISVEGAEQVLPYARLSKAVYDAERSPGTMVDDWEVVTDYVHGGSGFHATVFRNGADYALVFEGTNLAELQDLITDYQQANPLKSKLSRQYVLALVVAKDALKRYGIDHLVLAGHSLGGGLAQYAAAMLGLKAYCFNSAGLVAGWDDITRNGNFFRAAFSNIVHVVAKGYHIDPRTGFFVGGEKGSKELVTLYGRQMGSMLIVPTALQPRQNRIEEPSIVNILMPAAVRRAAENMAQHINDKKRLHSIENLVQGLENLVGQEPARGTGNDYLVLYHNQSLHLIKAIPESQSQIDYEIDFDLEAGDNLWRVFLLDEYSPGTPLPQTLTASNILAASDPRSYHANLEILDLMATLSWDTNRTDVDLHLVPDHIGNLARRGVDCFYESKTPHWGGAENNPELDIDDTDGFGPENIIVKTLKNGIYFVVVHYYEDHGVGPSNFNVTLRLKGAQPIIFGPYKLTRTGDRFVVATVKAENGRVTVVNNTRQQGGQ